MTRPSTIYRRALRFLSLIPALLLALLVAFVIYCYFIKTVFPLLGSYKHISTNLNTGANETHIVQASPLIKLVVSINAFLVLVFSCFFYASFYVASMSDPGPVPLDYIERHVGLAEVFKRFYGRRPVRSTIALRRANLPPNVRGRIGGEVAGSDLAKRSRRLSSRRIRAQMSSPINNNQENVRTGVRQVISQVNDQEAVINVHESTRPNPSSSSSPSTLPQTRLLTIRVSDVDLSALDEPGPHDPRWCSKCSQIKPPRTHHCSMCMRCVTKMDHHCPWVGNCVGFQNYKAFVLLLMYGFAAAVFSLMVWAPLMAGIWMPFSVSGDGGDPHPDALKEANDRFALGYTDVMAMFAFTLDASLCFSLMFLLGMHLYLISSGRTTLEAAWRGAHPYDLGSVRANWESVMGKQAILWFVPLGITSEILTATRSGTEWKLNGVKEIVEYPLPRKGELETIFGDDEFDIEEEEEGEEEEEDDIDSDVDDNKGGEQMNLLQG